VVSVASPCGSTSPTTAETFKVGKELKELVNAGQGAIESDDEEDEHDHEQNGQHLDEDED
jgi:hypothetical protein